MIAEAPFHIDLSDINSWAVVILLLGIFVRIGARQKQMEHQSEVISSMKTSIDKLTEAVNALNNDMIRHGTSCELKHRQHEERLKSLEHRKA